MKILIVEDETKVSRFLRRVFTEEGFAVDACSRGADAISQAMSGVYDVIVLDWMLPDMDGLEVCREVRRSGLNTPLLMLTARGETNERVMGLNAGADDYLIKPFEIDELLARVRALVRRSVGFTKVLSGALEIDRVERSVTLAGTALDLTTREYEMLTYLVQRADRVVHRSDLLSHVWSANFDPGSNIVEVHVSRLREKLGAHAWMIETVRGVGYRLRTQRPAS